MISQDPNQPARGRAFAELLDRADLPHAPLAMPKQTLEPQPRWLFAIYARLVRRT